MDYNDKMCSVWAILGGFTLSINAALQCMLSVPVHPHMDVIIPGQDSEKAHRSRQWLAGSSIFSSENCDVGNLRNLFVLNANISGDVAPITLSCIFMKNFSKESYYTLQMI